jgi:hypothetical protein
MKIQAKELRIGNYIKSTISRYRGQPFEVLGVFTDRIGIKYESPNPTYFLLDTVKPIPLTNKWLLDLGLKSYDNYPEGFYLGNYEVFYDVNEESWFFEIDSDGYKYHTEIKYVHQLQNLFFALTGEELTEIKNHPG